MNYLEGINKCVENLQGGGVILYPTDTIWGLGCDATNTQVIAKIYQIKKRAEAKSLIILCQDKTQISNYVDNSNLQISKLI
jgi:L-threonylcarbamoyladenylate synthase